MSARTLAARNRDREWVAQRHAGSYGGRQRASGAPEDTWVARLESGLGLLQAAYDYLGETLPGDSVAPTTPSGLAIGP